MSPGMTVGRVVAAPYLSALQADAQMQPLAFGCQALLATFHRLGSWVTRTRSRWMQEVISPPSLDGRAGAGMKG